MVSTFTGYLDQEPQKSGFKYPQFANVQMWVLTAKFFSIGPRTAPGPLRLQTSPGEGILSAGDLKTKRLQFQTERLQFQLKSEEMAQPTAWGSG